MQWFMTVYQNVRSEGSPAKCSGRTAQRARTTPVSLMEEERDPRWARGKEPTRQCRRHKKHGFDPWVGKIPLRKAWQTTPVFLPEEFMDREVWQTAVHRIAKSRTQLKQLSTEEAS